MGWCGSKSPEFPCPVILWWSEKKSNEDWIWDDTFMGRGRIVTTYDADDDENKEALCMQPKNDYFGSKIVAGKCKHGDSTTRHSLVRATGHDTFARTWPPRRSPSASAG